MANTVDSLVTVLELVGLEKFIGSMGSAAAATQTLAGAQVAASGATNTLNAALAGLAANPLVAVGAAIAALIGLVGKATDVFGESDLVATRLTVTMKNLGNVFPADQLLTFADQLQRTTGIDDELIASLGQLGAQFGLTRSQIERLLPTVLDVSALTGINPEQVERTLLRAARGRPQGLIAIGIDPGKIQGDIKDIDNLLSQVGEHFAGGAEAIRNTVPGAFTALTASIEELFEAFGRLFGSAAVSVINAFIKVIDGLTDAVNRLADWLGAPRPGATAASVKATGGDLALKGDPEQTGLLGQIANNTKQLNDSLVAHVLGGPGEVARRSIGLRDFGLAFGL